MNSRKDGQLGRTIGRYALWDEIASGGMATVHLGRLSGSGGFARTVAIKRLHPTYARDPDFVKMFVDEARLAARVQHPNVVPTLDVVELDDELFLVMEYVPGQSLDRLARATRRAGERIDPRLAVSVMSGVLHGLHAAHEATSERGEPLLIVHRDVSPQNVLVGTDGIARLLDFGVAKAVERAQSTAEGQVKGKVRYMSPEQLRSGGVDRRSDIFSAAIVLWEALAGRSPYRNLELGTVVSEIMHFEPKPPSLHAPNIPKALDEVVMRGLQRDPDQRFPTARDMAIALESAAPPVPPRIVGEWVSRLAHDELERRLALVARVESASATDSSDARVVALPPSPPPTADVQGSAPHADVEPSGTRWLELSGQQSPAAPAPALLSPDGRPSAPADVSTGISARVNVSVSTSPSNASVLDERRRALVIRWTAAAAAAGAALAGVLGIIYAANRPAQSGQRVSSVGAIVANSLRAQGRMIERTAQDTPPAASATNSAASAPEAHNKKRPVGNPPPRGTTVPMRPPPPAPTKPGCNPPYDVDSAGVKRYKVDCL